MADMDRLFHRSTARFLVAACLGLAVSCSPSSADSGKTAPKPVDAASARAAFLAEVNATAEKAGFPADLRDSLLEKVRAAPERFAADLRAGVSGDPYLHVLVDKKKGLGETYAPADLTPLSGPYYAVGRKGLSLRAEAARALETMGKAALKDGVRLVASSTYRSYAYQRTVYARVIAEIGQKAADRESAQPGHSQHQLGLAVDFGSIDDSFAKTKASRWLQANAGRFGWSISYPQGYEAVTGYRWESWHYRYVGVPLATAIDRYFGGIQQYALKFLDEWPSTK